MSTQTSNGKAFEYACLNALYRTLSPLQEIAVIRNAPLETAERFYHDLGHPLQTNLDKAAAAAARIVIRLEPQLQYPDRNIPLFLSLQSDAKGRAGDVRDVLCIRKQNGWEIGLSCKHNHHAVKHSRLSGAIDFGEKWFNIPCAPSYFSSVIPIFDTLQKQKRDSGNTALWADMVDKEGRCYVPVLSAFMNEIKRLDYAHPRLIPERLIRYLIGRNDFYKVITDDKSQTTRIEGINVSGTLNRPSEHQPATTSVAKLRLPTRFYNIDFKEKSCTTLEIVCDEGWTIAMRLHNASARIEPSLKFDVRLISLPHTIHAQVEPW